LSRLGYAACCCLLFAVGAVHEASGVCVTVSSVCTDMQVLNRYSSAPLISVAPAPLLSVLPTVSLLPSPGLQYTEELLRQQQFLEVYLEGTRSRSGKPSPARAGMLSIVVDTLCTGAIPDVLVVPVGISYDRILEGNYNSEQLVRQSSGSSGGPGRG